VSELDEAKYLLAALSKDEERLLSSPYGWLISRLKAKNISQEHIDICVKVFTDQCITSYEVFQQFSRDEFTKDLLISWGIKTAGLRIVLLDLFYECRKSKTEELSTAKETKKRREGKPLPI